MCGSCLCVFPQGLPHTTPCLTVPWSLPFLVPGSGFSLCPGGPWGQACEGHIPFAGAIKVAEQLTVGWETTWLGLTWPHGPRGQVCRRVLCC